MVHITDIVFNEILGGDKMKRYYLHSIVCCMLFIFLFVINFNISLAMGGLGTEVNKFSYLDDMPSNTVGGFIVKLKPNISSKGVLNVDGSKLGGKIEKLNILKVDINKSKKLSTQMLELSNDTNVLYVEPDYIKKLDYIPNDTNYPSQWGLENIRAPEAWNVTPGGDNSVIIAIIDSGVQTDHPDLTPNLITGYNTVDGSNNTNDALGHGTWVAGIAAASINNGIGVSGVAGKCKIMPIKVADSDGLILTSDTVEGVIWATDHGAKVINLSLGGTEYVQAEYEAIQYAYSRGVIVVASKGNANTTNANYPSDIEHVIAVGSVGQTNVKSLFSNYGIALDVMAPGEAIGSTLMNSVYGSDSGTSASSPFVAGLAALIISNRPGVTPDQVTKIITSTATDLGDAGFDIMYGYGLINAEAALNSTAPTPVIVTGITNSQTYGTSVTPTWIDEAGTTSTATLSKNGEAAIAYINGTIVNTTGNYELIVTTTKTINGLTSTVIVNFVVDVSVPTIVTVIGITNEQTYGTSVTPTWMDAAGTTSTATLSKDSEAAVEYTNGTVVIDDGSYVLVVTTTKTINGLTVTTTVNFTIDKVPPIAVTVEGVISEQTYGTSVTPTWIDVADTTSTATLSKNGEAAAVYINGTEINTTGSYELIVTTTKTINGLTSTVIVNFVVDVSVPIIVTVTGIMNEQTYGTSVTPTWTDAAGTTSTATLSKDGEVAVEYTNGTVVIDDGSYVMVVTTTKTINGLTSTTTVNFTIDKVPPIAVTAEGVANGQEYGTLVVPTWTDAVGTTSISTLTKDEVVSGYTKNTIVNSNGSYVLTITTTKTINGLTTVTVINFTVNDVTAPLINVTKFTAINAVSQNQDKLQGSAGAVSEVGAIVKAYPWIDTKLNNIVDDGELGTAITLALSTQDGSVTQANIGDKVDGTYKYIITATDGANNESVKTNDAAIEITLTTPIESSGGSGGGGGGGGGSSKSTVEKPSTQTEITAPQQIEPVWNEQITDGNKVISIREEIRTNEEGIATVSQSDVDSIINIIKEVSSVNIMQDENILTKKRVVLNVGTDGDRKNIQVNIPSEVVEAMSENNIDDIKVETTIASINIPLEVIKNQGKGVINLDIKVVETKELTKSQKEIIGDSIVYDFNLNYVTDKETTKITKFEKPIKIEIPYELKQGEDPKLIAVFYIKDDGTISNVQGAYDINRGKVLFTTNHFSKYMIKMNLVEFSDLTIYTEWAKESIRLLAAKGIISGREDKKFYPSDNITRAELAAILVNILQITDSDIIVTFKDVNTDDWYYEYVNKALNAGIIKGKSIDKFGPNDEVTRQDMAVMIIRTLSKLKEMGEVSNVDLIDKDNISEYALLDIQKAVNNQIIEGYEDNTFRPNLTATRSEVAVVAAKVLKIKQELELSR